MNSLRTAVVRAAMPNSSHVLPAAAPRSRMHGRGPGMARARGFTLIEIIIAFTILALGLGITMQIATGAMRNARHAAQRTEAALYAQSLLDSAGVGERLEEGKTSGDFDEDYRWELDVAPFEVESENAAAATLEPGLTPVQLYRLELVVTWGRRGRSEQEARFVTLRALTPDPGV